MTNLILFTTLIFCCSHVVYSNSSLKIHNVLNFVPHSRATQNSPAGRMRPGGRGLKTSALAHPCCHHVTQLYVSYSKY